MVILRSGALDPEEAQGTKITEGIHHESIRGHLHNLFTIFRRRLSLFLCIRDTHASAKLLECAQTTSRLARSLSNVSNRAHIVRAGPMWALWFLC